MASRASVVIPTYRQPEALAVTLRSFACQAQPPHELIVVDDEPAASTENIVRESGGRHVRYVPIAHGGRSAARNAGMAAAAGDIVIFCDGDRPVCRDFVGAHLRRHAARGDAGQVVIGAVEEWYIADLAGRRDWLMSQAADEFAALRALARRPVYARAVLQMFDADGTTRYAMPWIAFFSGNVSAPLELVRSAGGFDEAFREWGFEHFELGYRLFKSGTMFVHEPRALNYHIAHRRERGFYRRSIAESFRYFARKHGTADVALLPAFLEGEISLQDYHNRLRPQQPVAAEPPIRYRQLSAPSR